MTLHLSDATTPISVVPRTTSKPRTGFYRDHAKPIWESLLIIAMLPFIATVIAVCAVFVMMDGHNPFYQQKRIGKNGRIFSMWKLRTMVPNADQKLSTYLENNPAAKLEWDSTQKLKNDPRITSFGKLLRKTSIDELPQLFNVLMGHMSLIGPRPMMLGQEKLYSGNSYYNLRPGITGLWQISNRNESEFTARVHYDDLYDRTVSLRVDFWVAWRTIGVMIRGTGY